MMSPIAEIFFIATLLIVLWSDIKSQERYCMKQRYKVRVRIGNRLLSPEYFESYGAAHRRGRELIEGTDYTYQVDPVTVA